MVNSFSRRGFLAGAALSGIPAASAARVIGANDRINVGSIGVGGMGTGHLRALVAQSQEEKGGVQVVAVCDVYTVRRKRAQGVAKLEDKSVYNDYRELLGRSDVDAVFIATPDHWHAQMAIDAMAAGKDVYLQKPMTLTVDEARQTAEAARRHKRVLQVGSQHLSDPRHHMARKLIEQGEIGELLWAQGTYSRNSEFGEWNYHVDEQGTPENIDWPRWLGKAPKRPFSAERYFRWRKYWDYSGGIATDLFYHKLGPLLYAMGPQFPTRVTGSGGIYVQKDREVPDTYATVIEYPSFYVNMSSSMANAAPGKYFPEVIYGHKASIAFEGKGVRVVPEAIGRGQRRGEAAEAKFYETEDRGNLNRLHTDNFFACVRDRSKPVLNADLGYQIMTAIKLGVDSYREGKVKFFDPKTERETGKPQPRPAFEGDGKNNPEYRQR
ncbi:MAG: Gfo/Idh/MocA family protein [Bryobacteraceae bacterium]